MGWKHHKGSECMPAKSKGLWRKSAMCNHAPSQTDPGCVQSTMKGEYHIFVNPSYDHAEIHGDIFQTFFDCCILWL